MGKTKQPEHICRARVEAVPWWSRPCGSPAKVQDPNHPEEWYCGIHARQLIPGYENPAFAGTTLEQRRQARLAKQKAKHPEDFCVVEGCLRNAFSYNGNICHLHVRQAKATSPVVASPPLVEVAAEVRDLLAGKKGE